MEEFFVNDYVIQVEGGHPGRAEYTLIATPEAWRQLIAELNFGLDRYDPEKALRKNEHGEVSLSTKYATISKGQTTRVYVSCRVAHDLNAHHVRPGLKAWFYNNGSCLLLILGFIVLLYLAGVGLTSLYNG